MVKLNGGGRFGIIAKCPACGEESGTDLGCVDAEELMTGFSPHFYCRQEDCGADWSVNVTLTLDATWTKPSKRLSKPCG